MNTTYKNRRMNGLCVKCGNQADGKAYCDKCDCERKTKQKQRYEKLKKDGRCVYCAKEVTGGCICDGCKSKLKSKRESNRNNGICYICKKQLTDTNMKACPGCRSERTIYRRRRNFEMSIEDYERQLANSRLYYRLRIERGLCSKCSKPIDNETTICNECRLKNHNRYKTRMANECYNN